MKLVLKLLMQDQRVWMAAAGALFFWVITCMVADPPVGMKRPKTTPKPKTAKPKPSQPKTPPELEDEGMDDKGAK